MRFNKQDISLTRKRKIEKSDVDMSFCQECVSKINSSSWRNIRFEDNYFLNFFSIHEHKKVTKNKKDKYKTLDNAR